MLMFNTVLVLQTKHDTIIRVCRSTPGVKSEGHEAGVVVVRLYLHLNR